MKLVKDILPAFVIVMLVKYDYEWFKAVTKNIFRPSHY